MKLIEISEEEFDSIYIAEKLNDNIFYDNYNRFKSHNNTSDGHYYESDNNGNLHIKTKNIKDQMLFLNFVISNNLNGVNPSENFYICILQDSIDNRIEIQNFIKKHKLEYIDKRIK